MRFVSVRRLEDVELRFIERDTRCEIFLESDKDGKFVYNIDDSREGLGGYEIMDLKGYGLEVLCIGS